MQSVIRCTSRSIAFAKLVGLTFFIVFSSSSSLKSAESIDFEDSVAPLLKRRCGGCHAGERAKAGFQIHDRDSVLGYIEPGDIESSILWTDYLKAPSAHVDPATYVMPLSGPLPENELKTLKDWIEGGADWPEGVKLVSFTGLPTLATTTERTGVAARLCGFLGYFHPAIVHFPIALLMFGAASAALSFFTGGRAVYVAFYCLLWGTVFAIVASALGWCFAAEKGYPDWSTIPNQESLDAAATLFRHRWLGTATAVASLICLIIAIIAYRKPTSMMRHAWRIGLLIVAIMVAIVGHQGGELVYGDLLHQAFDRLFGV